MIAEHGPQWTHDSRLFASRLSSVTLEKIDRNDIGEARSVAVISRLSESIASGRRARNID